MTLAEAIAADCRGEWEIAAARYEVLLKSDHGSPVVWMNLSVLYWQAADPGNYSARSIFQTGGNRFLYCLERGVEQFPHCVELEFWRKYIGWTDLGEALSVEQCVSMMSREPGLLTPLIYICAVEGIAKYAHDVARLRRQCRMEPTARARYISSVLESHSIVD